jgi:xanthine dehydrogenase accessory factor
MLDILPTLEKWREENRSVALATVVRTLGSSPRRVGARMAVTGEGAMVGSVSGGCVEGAVSEEALEVLRTGRPRLLTFGVADEEAWAVGLSCGGTIQVLVEPLAPGPGAAAFDAYVEAVRSHRPVALVSPVGNGEGETTSRGRLLVDREGNVTGTLGSADLDGTAAERAMSLLEGGGSGMAELAGAEERFFVEVHRPPPRLVVVGAVHIAVVLSRLARELGFRVVVCDARDRFATPERFPEVEELILGWPGQILPQLDLDEFSYVVVITHDAKLDNPALQAALASPAPYVGALGSSRTHARRVEALREAGVEEEDIRRIHAPIGLDIGARTPAEIALATLAQIVAVRRGRDPEP